MRRSLNLMRTALNHADLCLGQHTLAVFRSPAFNFDPVNTFKQQAAFAQRMRPIVEEFGAVFVDLFPATLRAAFPPPSVPDATLRAAFPPPSVPVAEQIASMQVLTTAPCHLFPTGARRRADCHPIRQHASAHHGAMSPLPHRCPTQSRLPSDSTGTARSTTSTLGATSWRRSCSTSSDCLHKAEPCLDLHSRRPE